MIRKKKLRLSNQPKLLLTLDWLTLNVEDNFKLVKFPENQNSFAFGDVVIEPVTNGRTQHFHKMLNVWHDGERVAVVTYDASNVHILKNRAHIKFDNHLFYDGRIQEVVELIIGSFNLQSVKVSRVDIACDGVFFHKFLNQYLYGDNSKMGVRRVSDDDNIRPSVNDRKSIAKRSFDAFSIGTPGNKVRGTSKSARFARYYNKTQEISELNHKQYINEYYKLNGFTGTNPVYRFEIEMRSAFLATVSDFSYLLLFQAETLESLFRTATVGFFEWRTDDNAKITRCSPFELFAGVCESIFQRVKRVVLDAARSIKILVKRVIKEHITGMYSSNAVPAVGDKLSLSDFYSDRSYSINWVRSMVGRFNLSEWLANKFPYICLERQDYALRRALIYNEVQLKLFM